MTGDPSRDPVSYAGARTLSHFAPISNSSNEAQTSSSVNNVSTTAPLEHGPRPTLLSCITCRRRKVKCDKKQPCIHCTKMGIECVYPASGRKPRRPRRPQDRTGSNEEDLMRRLKKLEEAIANIGATTREEQSREYADQKEEIALHDSENEIASDDFRTAQRIEGKRQEEQSEGIEQRNDNPHRLTGSNLRGLEVEFGRLVVDAGRSRYVNPSFWASLDDEVEDIRGILDEEPGINDDVRDICSPDPSVDSLSSPQSYFLGSGHKAADLLSLHPRPEHIMTCWEVFKDRVDPLIKILHIPTIEPVILKVHDSLEQSRRNLTRIRLDQIQHGIDALMFVIYYSAITAMSPDEVQQSFGEEKLCLILRYRSGFEQALTGADFLHSNELIFLQAYTIFLICRNDDARISWILTGLVVRMAQTLGLHRDGSHFELNPFEIEMRRRLWWQIRILDSRASDDHGSDSITGQFDTRMPLNLNDEDISPEMISFPKSKVGCTETTFGLIRFEVIALLRKIQEVPVESRTLVPLEKKESWIKECYAMIDERYIKHFDMSKPLCWYMVTVLKLMRGKMVLMIYHPCLRQACSERVTQEIKDKLFFTSLDVLESGLAVANRGQTRKWNWLFHTYIQWHAIAFLLNELCVRTWGEHVERAWNAIEYSRTYGAEYANGKLKSHLWRPLRRLLAKARAAREVQLQKKKEATIQAIYSEGSNAEHSTDLGVVGNAAGIDFQTLANMTSLHTDAVDPLSISSSQSHANGPFTSVTSDCPRSQPLSDFPLNLPLSEPVDSSGIDLNMGFDWLFSDAAVQTSPGSSNHDVLMPDGNVDWEKWDQMVAQVGAAEREALMGKLENDRRSVPDEAARPCPSSVAENANSQLRLWY
ncbi:hypothetical protein NA57DRAFT_50511 [Rhizodiscina lignyota]|uniref:Zn(2)-C6 fungal-type domain-containing protein n=1 Tax=Rhizodiscina lignyota TaxID=1504668 RepID=A0A9P4IQ36_9PEZI|nr:hypothetical protein NA57DRAFT_50511 [Rhizodiscina lignyota]